MATSCSLLAIVVVLVCAALYFGFVFVGFVCFVLINLFCEFCLFCFDKFVYLFLF